MPGDVPSSNRRTHVASGFRACGRFLAGFRNPWPFHFCPAYAYGYTLPPGVTCCRRLRGSGVLVATLSMGSRPRLSAAAASRLYSNPRADARGNCLFKSSAPERVGVAGRAALRGLAPRGLIPSNSRRPHLGSAFRVCGDLFAGFRIPFPFQTCPAYACGYTLPPGVTCCRRLRGSGVELLGSMGSRPRLSAAAASRLLWNPRA